MICFGSNGHVNGPGRSILNVKVVYVVDEVVDTLLHGCGDGGGTVEVVMVIRVEVETNSKGRVGSKNRRGLLKGGGKSHGPAKFGNGPYGWLLC